MLGHAQGLLQRRIGRAKQNSKNIEPLKLTIVHELQKASKHLKNLNQSQNLEDLMHVVECMSLWMQSFVLSPVPLV